MEIIKYLLTFILLSACIVLLNMVVVYLTKIYPSLNIILWGIYYPTCFYMGWIAQDIHDIIWKR